MEFNMRKSEARRLSSNAQKTHNVIKKHRKLLKVMRSNKRTNGLLSTRIARYDKI